MQEMAAAYEGPHQVLPRQNEINLGTALHVQCVGNSMSGELLVVAAGDDISIPQRVKTLVRLWVKDKERTTILHSAAMSFKDGDIKNASIMPLRVPNSGALDIDFFINDRRNPIIAPTAAYSKCIFEKFPPLIGGSVIEDGPLIFRGFLTSGFLESPAPLVYVRKQPETSGTGFSYKNIPRWNTFLRSRIISNFNSLNDLHHSHIGERARRSAEKHFISNIQGLSKSILYCEHRSSFYYKAKVFSIVFLNYPVSYGFFGNLAFSLKFSGIMSDKKYTAFRKLFYSIFRRN